MKLFNTIQELWDHCTFCPICKDNCREMQLSVGPTDISRLLSYTKKDHLLHIKSRLHLNKQGYFVNYIVNCTDNTFDIKISSPEDLNTTDNDKGAYFYFVIKSDCKKCNYSYCNSVNLIFDLYNQKIVNIGIEKEGVYLIDNADSIHVLLDYNYKRTIIHKCIKYHGEIKDLPDAVICPLLKLDMKDSDKAINKIKTFIIFS